MNAPRKPSVLFVFYTHTEQSRRVADAMAGVLRERGCDVSLAGIEFTDPRYAGKFGRFPFRHAVLDLLTVLPAQVRRSTGQIRIPDAAREGDYDLVCFGSPTWFFTANMPLRSYLKSAEAGKVLAGKRFAAYVVFRRYWSINLKEVRKLDTAQGGTYADVNDLHQEWRRLVAELLGTFFLVLAAAGGGMMGHAFPGVISHTAAVTAPALTVMAIILFLGKISGAPLHPAVSIAFALRRDLPWHRVPGYIVVQLIGATLAALILHAIVNVSASYGSSYPASGYSAGAAFWMEVILTTGLVSVILGTASGAQNVGVIGAFGVGGYIALAGLWGSPISGASMNPARTFGPDLASTTFTSYWVYIAGPIAGAVIAVGIAFVLRGRGGGKSGAGAAQGDLFTEAYEPGKS